MLIRGCEVEGRLLDVRVTDRVLAVGSLEAATGEEVVEADAGALLPGLHDHHVHLLATARARTSVDVSLGLDVLRGVPGTGWVRAVGLAHDADADALDRAVGGRPVRVQHRSGALWVLSSAALREVDAAGATEPGIERDHRGAPTGRLWRCDAWLAHRTHHAGPAPDLAALGRELLDLGVTGVTDATPVLTAPALELLLSGILPQRMQLLAANAPAHLAGPRKLVLADHDLPALDDVVDAVRVARVEGRAIAAHAVTREALVLLLAALDAVGPVPGDRVEHAAVADADLAAWMAGLGVAVCTQPGFLTDRGDDYLRDVAPVDLPDLYPHARLLAAGVPTVVSSDAPHGPLDPWAVMRAARDRTAPSGVVLNPHERVSVRRALDGYLRPLEDLAAPIRRVQVGEAGGLLLLHASLAEVLAAPSAELVRRVWPPARAGADGPVPDAPGPGRAADAG